MKFKTKQSRAHPYFREQNFQFLATPSLGLNPNKDTATDIRSTKHLDTDTDRDRFRDSGIALHP